MHESHNNEIDLIELVRFFWSKKWYVICLTSIATLITILVLVKMPNQFRATALVVSPSESTNGNIGQIAGNLGGLASLAGLNLGAGGQNSLVITIEKMKSRAFIISFIRAEKIEELLMGTKGWDITNNSPIFDEQVYDSKDKVWVRDAKFPQKVEPSDLELYSTFKEIFLLELNEETGVLSISIDYYSPEIASLWVTRLIESINTYIRETEELEAQKSIDYLNREIAKVELAEGRKVLFELLEEQTKKLMFTNIRQDYALKTIDPAIAPEKKISPKRALILIFVVSFVLIISTVFLTVLFVLRHR